jgi:hypothetical protein
MFIFLDTERISRLTRLVCLVAIFFMPTFSAASDDLFPPANYLRTKLQQNDIVFLGTKHKRPEILGFIAGLISSLKGLG